MAVYSTDFHFDTQGEFDIVNLTARVEEVIRGSGVTEGMALVFAGHATGVLMLNEYDRDLLEDLKGFMRGLLPAESDYRHPGNAHAHLRSMLFTPSRALPVHDGRLGLGTWQSLYWVEAERCPRRRRVEVTVVGE